MYNKIIQKFLQIIEFQIFEYLNYELQDKIVLRYISQATAVNSSKLTPEPGRRLNTSSQQFSTT